MQSPNPFEGVERRGVTFERIEEQTPRVTTPEGSVALPFDAAEPMVRTGGHHGTRGAVLGMLIGPTVGALSAYLGYEPEYRENRSCEIPWPRAIPRNCQSLGLEELSSRSAPTLAGGATGFWVGLLGGYIAGRHLPRWERLEIDSPGVGSLELSAGVGSAR